MNSNRVEESCESVQYILEKYNNIVLEGLYINQHTEESTNKRYQFSIRKVDFSKTELCIAFQKMKGSFIINDFKFIIKLDISGKPAYAVLNIYEKDGLYYGKVLTVLSEHQFILSKNFYFGSVLGCLQYRIKEIKNEEKFFDGLYSNILNGLDYKKENIELPDSIMSIDTEELKILKDLCIVKNHIIKVEFINEDKLFHYQNGSISKHYLLKKT